MNEFGVFHFAPTEKRTTKGSRGRKGAFYFATSHKSLEACDPVFWLDCSNKLDLHRAFFSLISASETMTSLFSAQNMFPSLCLTKQTSLCEDTVTTKHGLEKNAHVVVKNSPFCVTFGFSAPTNNPSSLFKNVVLDFHKYTVDVKLLYDADLEKEVDFLSEKPFQYKPTINQSGTKLTLEVRIKVLTSQLEHMLFKVGLKLFDPHSNQLMFEATSDPIKVISKSDQVKKKKVPRKKASSVHELGDFLMQIEQRQEEYNALLEKIADTNQIFLQETVKRQKISKNNDKGIFILLSCKRKHVTTCTY